jgi:predicted alpha/beta-hydrolase family hydrolase
MAASAAEPITIPLPGGASVSGLVDSPADPQAVLVLAHGAGAGMAHSFLASLAGALAGRGVATLRFNFPYLELGSKRPDPPVIAQGAVRAAVAHAAARWPGLPLFAGGKSFGGRMTTQAQAAAPLEGVRGIVLVGFPLHPAGKPSTERAGHLGQVDVPMLFLQGTRDALAELSLLRDVLPPLGSRATLHVVEGADHSFHVLARSGRNDAQVLDELVGTAVAWLQRFNAGSSPA